MHGVRTVSAPERISEIISGIILKTFVSKASDIASGMASISNLFSKYFSILCMLGLVGTITAAVKYLIMWASTWGLPVPTIRVFGDY